MDPFLEDQAIFPDLHDSMIFCLREALQAKLPAHYYAAMRSRIWVESALRIVQPDVDVLHRESKRKSKPASGGLAVAEKPTKPLVVEVMDDETRESYMEICRREDTRERLVTALEVLSLSNKSPRDQGRKLYRQKQREVLRSKAHLVEIDLLRSGHHTTLVPLDRLLRYTAEFDYHVCIHRADKARKFFVYPIGLRERLPVIEVPLLKGDDPVTVDLQAVFDRCYVAADYGPRARYEDERPNPPLRPKDAKWAVQLLRDQGLLAED